MDKKMDNTANRVKELRKLRKMTQAELANACGVVQGSIQKLENGQIILDLEWMQKLANALDVKAYELLPIEMQPEETTPQEREILRMIRKTAAPQEQDNIHLPPQTNGVAPAQTQTPASAKPNSNER